MRERKGIARRWIDGTVSERWTIVRFLVVGGLNTLVGHGTVFFCMLVISMNPIISNVTGYAIGIGFAFLMHKHVTFRTKGNAVAEFLRFLPAFAVSFAINLGVLMALLTTGVSDIASQVAAAAAYVASSFLLNRLLVFRAPPP